MTEKAGEQFPVHKKRARARASWGLKENLSKPYIQRKFRRLAGIGRLGTRRPLKRPSLIAAYVKRFKEYTRRHDRVDAPSKDTSGEVRSRCASSVFGASGNPGGAAEKVNYRGLVMPSALTPSPAGRSPHRARCARAGTAERCLRRLSAKKYELLDIEKMLSQAATFSV